MWRRPRKHRGVPRYWRVRLSADGGETFWHEPAARDRSAWPVKKLSGDKAKALRECEARNAEMDRWRRGLRGPDGQGDDGPVRGTIAALVEQYQVSSHWLELSPRTRRDYKKHLDELAAGLGTVPVIGITPQAVARYKATLAPGRQGNYRLSVLSVILSFAREHGEIAVNPALRHKRFKLAKRDAYWCDEDVEAFLAQAGAPMRLALMLGLWTGQRQGDVLKMRWSDIKDGWLTLRQGKTQRQISIPVSTVLAGELERFGRRGIVILVGERGAPYTGNGFHQQWRKTTMKAGLAGRLTFLDLRRSAVVRLAEAGCSVSQIASITGHTIDETSRIIDTYWVATKTQAKQAMMKLERAERRKPKRSALVQESAQESARTNPALAKLLDARGGFEPPLTEPETD